MFQLEYEIIIASTAKVLKFVYILLSIILMQAVQKQVNKLMEILKFIYQITHKNY